MLAIHACDVLQTAHHVVNQPVRQLSAHRRLFLLLSLHLEVLNHRADRSPLQEHRPKHHGYCRCHELLLARDHLLVQNERQCEGHGAPDTAVAHYQHVGDGELKKAPAVGDVRQDHYAYDAVYRAGDDGDYNEACVPGMRIRDLCLADKIFSKKI